MTIILVFAGGILGGITRYLLGKALPPYLGTLIANMCACLTLGIIARLFEAHSFAYAAGGIGFAGALSTWSTLANELGHLLKPITTGSSPATSPPPSSAGWPPFNLASPSEP